MIDTIGQLLSQEDDPEFWQLAVSLILSDVEKQTGISVEIGSCSHWIKPHGFRWAADGGFASPHGYNPTVTGYSYRALPQFEWSIVLQWTGDKWKGLAKPPRKISVRIAIPARTARHKQAAIHSVWRISKDIEIRFYGFRKSDDGWKCTAISDFNRTDHE